MGECSQLAVSFVNVRDVWSGITSTGEGSFDKMELFILCCLLMVNLAVLLTNVTPVGVMGASFMGAHLHITVL